MSRKNIECSPIFTCLLFSFLLTGGCGRGSGRKSLENTLEARITAIRKQDITMFMKSVAPDYNDGRDTFASIEQNYRNSWNQIKIMAYKITSQRINISSTRASVFQRYELVYQKEGKRFTRSRDEVLKFKKTESGWRIYEGLNPL